MAGYCLIFLMVVVVLPQLCSAQGMTQEKLDNMAHYLDIKYEVVDNFRDDLRLFESQLTFTNRGQEPFPGAEWELIWSQQNLLEPDHLPNEAGYILDKYKVKLSHMQGGMFKLEPISGFRSIRPGEKRTIRYVSENYSVAKSDTYPNWYLASRGLEERVVEATTGESLSFVGEFDQPNKWKRYDFKTDEAETRDQYDPFTPRARYFMNSDVRNLGRPTKLIIPTPVKINVDTSATLNLETKDWQIVSPPVFLQRGAIFSKYVLFYKLGFKVTDQKPHSHYIWFNQVEVKVRMNSGEVSNDEVYELDIDPLKGTIEIRAAAKPGAFYAVQSLLNIMDDRKLVPRVQISDGPRYPYRGVMLDVARNFHPKDHVMRLLDTMAMYKLNKFHLHMTDDEGWRLEIPGLEELTQVGSQRCHDPDETKCLLPFLGSGPVASSPGSGFYSTEDYKDILRHAKSLHIEVIPELDMPGHGHAAIKSMEARRQKMLDANNLSEVDKYSLVDPNDPSRYKSIQLFTDNAINPCLQSTYTFISKVLNELIELHREIMPLNIYHFGGDEVAKGAWENSSFCENYFKDQGVTFDHKDIKKLFVSQVSNLTASLGLDLGAWEDGVMESGNTPYSRNLLQNQNAYGYAWNNIWEWGTGGRAYSLANAGYKVVMAQATHLYFDHPYEPDPEERGLYWAPRYTDTRKTFGFMPQNLYLNADVARSGKQLSRAEICGKNGEFCPTLNKPENIMGIQGHLWSEIIRNQDLADQMLYPRVLSLAERAWHEAGWESDQNNKTRNERQDADWTSFANTLGYRELKRLDEKGLKYAVPPPGAILKSNILKTNVAYPGLKVEVSIDEGASWCEVKPNQRVPGSVTLLLRTKSADGGRTSRVVSLKTPAIKLPLASTATTTVHFYFIYLLFSICISSLL